MTTIIHLTSTDNWPYLRNVPNTNFSEINADLVEAEWIVETLLDVSDNASLSQSGITKLASAPASATNPIALWDNDPRIPTQSENDAISGSYGTPSSGNKLVTALDANYTWTAKTTGNETIAGVKTFTSIPIVPTPTTADQLVTKAYFDSIL